MTNAPSNPLQVVVIARDQSERVQQTWKQLHAGLRARPAINVVGALTAEETAHEEVVADMALVIGGDGAILRACRSFGARQIPVLGLNQGRLGFLADIPSDEIDEGLDFIEQGKYKIVHHIMFECELHRRDGTSVRHIGLNETSILSAGSLAMIDVELAIEGQHVTTYSGDGLIISTPVGSTAHSLSAGGPILRQDLEAFVVTPICPHTLTVRPLVDRADVEYELTAPHAPEGVTLVIDGQIREPFRPGDRAVIRRAPFQFQLVRLASHSYYGTLHRKLGWDGQPRYRRGRISETDHAPPPSSE
ncbi:MAG: NAD(+)/NADH kinase [Planctomycetaceae bacterium]